MDPRSLPPNWPFRADSRHLDLAPHHWWLADLGPREAPVLLLLHGTGASLHSFRRLALGLTARFRVVIPDLPGQGCSQSRAFDRMGLDGMASDLWRLCDALGIAPAAVIGHSAGAAIGLRMAELRPLPAVIGLNAALGGFDGMAAVLFPMIAKALATAPFLSRLAARSYGKPDTVNRLLAGTGSPLEAEGRAQYLRLVQDADHVAGALAMMAGWKLQGLLSRLPQTRTAVWLIASTGDRAVPARVSEEAATKIPGAKLTILPDLGHLAHEEAADGLASLILPWLQTVTAPKI